MVELSIPIQTDDSGFEFVLKDDEAIKLLRFREDQRGPLSQEYNIIDKGDLYSNEPWKVFGDDHIWHSKTTKGGVTTSTTYVFTELTKKGSSDSKRYLRGAGDGTWHQENTPHRIWEKKLPDRILNSGGTFGVMIALSFRIHGKRIPDWNMHEYSLRRDQPPHNYVSDRVLCKITRKVKDSPPEQSSSTVIGNNNPANKRAAEEVVLPAVQACSSSSNKMQKVSVVGSVPPTLTSIASSSNKEKPGDDHISSSNKENSTAESDAELVEYMEKLPDLIPGFHRLNFEA